jgi:hypothetical protein
MDIEICFKLKRDIGSFFIICLAALVNRNVPNPNNTSPTNHESRPQTVSDAVADQAF